VGVRLVPPAIRFMLDLECRNAQERTALEKLSKNPIKWLARRMYENYLLEPRAIAEVLATLDTSAATPVAETDIRAAIEAKLKQSERYCDKASPVNEHEQRSKVHGAEILQEIFSQFSETRVRYEKIRDGVRLTGWFVAHELQTLQEISDILRSIFD